ncbi:LysR family transcriptional regulator [Variovorax ureilyticus]|uniref:LysR family transcriptional regulator n=1 Tax=Variovorax ureilyticus TaxID=1836198 RepID=A0ABU8VJS7_9BURK
MDSLDLIRTFREVASHGSFSRAASKLDVSKATVSKYIAELESRLGVRLLNRSTRAVSLTDAGSLLLERSKPMMEMFEDTQAEVQEHASRPTGRLRISAPLGAGQGDLPKMIGEFMGHYPDVSITLHLSNRSIDMAEEGIDLSFHFGPIEDENLIVRKLARRSLVVCASPVYWRKHGKPTHPSELANHDALTHSRLGLHPQWRFEVDGKPFDVQMRTRMDSNESAPLIQIAMQGFGVIYMPEMLVQPHVDQGELVPVLEPYSRSDMWLSAAYLQRRHNSAALRALLDFLEMSFRRQGKGGR